MQTTWSSRLLIGEHLGRGAGSEAETNVRVVQLLWEGLQRRPVAKWRAGRGAVVAGGRVAGESGMLCGTQRGRRGCDGRAGGPVLPGKRAAEGQWRRREGGARRRRGGASAGFSARPGKRWGGASVMDLRSG